jgi:hypothetical protein
LLAILFSYALRAWMFRAVSQSCSNYATGRISCRIGSDFSPTVKPLSIQFTGADGDAGAQS